MVYQKKYIFGNYGWDRGVNSTKDNKAMASLLGLARSAEYVLEVDQDKYLSELKNIIKNYQEDLAQVLFK